MKAQHLLLIIIFITAFIPIVVAECGNSQCEEGENACSCPGDCGTCSGEVQGRGCSSYYCTDKNICAIKVIPNCCGNEWCEVDGSYEEDFGSCPADCEPKNVNITIVSPEEGYKARYGEEILYKAMADADGRSIAGIKIKISDPSREFTLFNDGLHDDNRFNDNVFATTESIEQGIDPGDYNIVFSTEFRNIEGLASIELQVYPAIDIEVELAAEIELGNTLNVNGRLSINDKPTSTKFKATIFDDSEKEIAEKEIESDSEGYFKFDYRSTFIDQLGNWKIVFEGQDNFGNKIFEEKSLFVFEPGKLPERNISLIKTLKESYSPEEEIEIAIKVEEESGLIEEARVTAEAFGVKQELSKIGPGEYAGIISAVVESGGLAQELIIKVYNSKGGLIAIQNYPLIIEAGKLNAELLAPVEKVFSSGETIEIKILLTNQNNSLVQEAEVYALINGKKLVLKKESEGIFSANYKITEETGALEIAIIAKTPAGAEGNTRKNVFVSGKDFFSGVEITQEIGIALLLGLIVLGVIGVKLKEKSEKKGKKDRLAELDNLEKTAQKMYLREKTINKKEYNKLMEKYNKQRRELG